MREARRAVGFCYLCGKELPKKRHSATVGEHVIPKKLLGTLPSTLNECWPIELDVHPECEDRMKQEKDHYLKLFQELNTKPRCDWASPEQVRKIPISPRRVHLSDGSSWAAFEMGELLEGAWMWIRGIHAAIYREFLPPDVPSHVFPPVPSFSSSPDGPSLKEAEEISHLTRSVIQLGLNIDKWDGVVAWGGAVQYHCIWYPLATPQGMQGWLCCWTLTIPGLLEWSGTVLPPGAERPWHGQYCLTEPPHSASILVSEDFPEHPSACN